jgi:predicted CoA-binding protein
VITPPHVSEAIVEQAGVIGVKNIWFQPGAESEKAVARAIELGMNVIAGGPCILIVLGYKETKATT